MENFINDEKSLQININRLDKKEMQYIKGGRSRDIGNDELDPD